MHIKKHIPNALTCGNVLCGCLAIVRVNEGNLTWACYFVGIALILDFLDGFTARMLKVSSPIGKDLDSLADLITFGVVPAMIMFKLIDFSYTLSLQKCLNSHETFTLAGIAIDFRNDNLIKYFAFVIAIFSAIRLAKFNNDTRQTDSFIGLATPANTIIICGFCMVLKQLELDLFDLDSVLENEQSYNDTANITGIITMYLLSSPILLCLISLGLSLLLISELPLFALKFKNFGWRDNKVKYIFLVLCLILILSLQFVAIPLIIFLYIILSVVNNIFLKKQV